MWFLTIVIMVCDASFETFCDVIMYNFSNPDIFTGLCPFFDFTLSESKTLKFDVNIKVPPKRETQKAPLTLIVSLELALYCQKRLLVCLHMRVNLSDSPLVIHRVPYEVGPPFAAISAAALLRYWEFLTSLTEVHL